MISIIMSVYNDEKYLSESIESILNQTYENFEFIIVDDCSSDNSLNIIKSYAFKDARIKIIENEKNLGLAASLNKAWKKSKYQFIARMDSDDVCYVHRLATQFTFLQQNPSISIVGSSAQYIDEQGNNISIVTNPENDLNIKIDLIKRNCIIHPSVMFRENVLESCSGYIENLKNAAEDYDLWLNARSKGFCFHNIKEPLIKYRLIYSNRTIKRIFNKFVLHLYFISKYDLPPSKYLYSLLELMMSLAVKYNLYTPKSLRGHNDTTAR